MLAHWHKLTGTPGGRTLVYTMAISLAIVFTTAMAIDHGLGEPALFLPFALLASTINILAVPMCRWVNRASLTRDGAPHE